MDISDRLLASPFDEREGGKGGREMGRERGREMWGRGKRGAYLCDSKAIKADWSARGGSLFENLMMPKKGWRVIGCYISGEPPPHLPANEYSGS